MIPTIAERGSSYQKFNESMKTHVANHHYQVNGVSYIDNGYFTWKYISSSYYLYKSITLPWINFKKLPFYRQGYSIHEDVLSSSSCNEILELRENAQAINIVGSLLSNWESKYLPQGLSLVPYRSHIYDLPKDVDSASCFWHYDVEQPDNSIYFLIYLDDPKKAPQNAGGTFILDTLNSAALSISTGYISSPIENRAYHLNQINPNIHINELFVDAIQGRMLSFMPSRCLHKGLPSGEAKFKRRALHISAQIFELQDSEQYNNISRLQEMIDTSFHPSMQNCGYPLPFFKALS